MLKDKIHVSETELVYTDDQLSYTVDGSCCTLRRPDGKIDFLTTDLGGLPYYHHFRGPADDPFAEELEPFEWDYNHFKEEWPCGLWVQSAYKCEDGVLIGFTHREDLSKVDFDYPQNYHIGFSISRDGGQHWKYIGDMMGTCRNFISKNRSNGVWPNICGVPYVVGKDGYFYIFYNEWNEARERYTSVARIPVKESIEMVRREENPAKLMKKYSGNGVWDTEPMHGTAPRILPEDCDDIVYHEEVGFKYDCHSQAAYCSAIDKYILVVQTARQVVMFMSDDCVNWDDHVVLSTANPDKGLYMYSTIVGCDDEASDDSSTVGHDFYVYFTHKIGFLRLPGNFGDYETDHFCRVRVTIDK